MSIIRFTSLALALAVCAALLSGCAATPTPGPSGAGGGPAASRETPSPTLENCAITRDAVYGNIYLDVAIERFNGLSYEEPARNYLKTAGMSDGQIDALVARLTR